MNHRALPFMSALLVLPASAATVNTGSLTTSTGPIFPFVPSVNQSTSITVNLSDMTGLTPGSDIAITFASTDDLIWTGGFGADTGDLTLLFHARLTLTAGSYSTFSDETWSFGPVPWEDAMNTTDPVGYSIGPVPQSFSLTVPWGTDLSSVTFTLTDLFSVTGVNAYVTESNLALDLGSLTTTSIPEPSVLLFSLAGLGSLLIRRRHRATSDGGITLITRLG